MLDHRTSKKLVKRLQNSLFGKSLETLANLFDRKLWLTGGWVRSIALGNVGYSGDIDFLVESSHEEISENLIKAGLNTQRTRLGGFRVPLEASHIDLISSHGYGPSASVSDVLEYFNVTINGAAINLVEPAFIIELRSFSQDANLRRLKFLVKGLMLQDECNRALSMRSSLRLLFHDNLTLAVDDNFLTLLDSMSSNKKSFEIIDEVITELRAMGRLSDEKGWRCAIGNFGERRK